MVLVDTSVWIRFVHNRAPYAAELQGLLLRGEGAGHDLIYGELLIGDPGARRKLLLDYDHMHWIRTVPHEDVVAFVRVHKLHGLGIGWIDAHLLAAALVARVSLWTADEPLAALARRFDVAYVPNVM
jgi:predicted nucleic acid-binding protein